MAMRPAHFLFLMLINLVFAIAVVTVKFGTQELPPLLFTTLRFLILAVVLLPFLDVHKGRMIPIVIISLGAGGLQFALFYGAIYMTGNVSAVVIAGELGVPFTTILGMVFLAESVGWRRWVGMLLAFGGVVFITFDPGAFNYLNAMFLGALGAASGAVASIFMRLLKDVKPFELQSWIAMISWPPLLLLTLIFEHDIPTAIATATWVGWGTLLFAAFVSNLFGHAGMFFLIQRYEVGLIAPLTLVGPIMTITLSVIFVGDVLTWQMLVGGAITTLGVLIISLRAPAEAVRVEEAAH